MAKQLHPHVMGSLTGGDRGGAEGAGSAGESADAGGGDGVMSHKIINSRFANQFHENNSEAT